MITNPHDKFVKDRLLEKQNAIDFLQISLSEKLISRIDLDTLEAIPNNFITKKIKELFSDIFYKCKLKDGRDAYCNILIEHKSYEDKHVSFQICEYLSAAYRQQLKDDEELIPIIPIVFTHHNKDWKYKSMSEYFDQYGYEFTLFIPKFDIIFFDVNDLIDDQIYTIRSVAIRSMFMTQKYINNPVELLNRMQKIYESLQTQEERNSFNTNFVYMLMASKNQDKIIEIIEKESYKTVNKVFMSLYEEITLKSEKKGEQIGIQKGEQIGIQKGEQIGIQKGKEEKTIEFVLDLFQYNMPISEIGLLTKISDEQVIEILKNNNKL